MRRLSDVFVLTVVCLAVVTGAVGPAVAAGAVSPPPPPAAYYGSLTVNGEPAPAGITVTAHIDGEVRGRMVTTQTGAYGSPSAFDSKLQVDGTADDAGKPVEFFVSGVRATTTVVWRSGDVRQVDLAVTGDVTTPNPDDDNEDESSNGGTGDKSGDGTDRGGQGQVGGGSQSGTQTPTTGGIPDTQTAITIERIDSQIEVTVSNASKNEVVHLNVTDETTTAEAVSLDSIEIATATGDDFSLTVTQFDDLPTNPPAVEDAPLGTLGYIQIDHSVPDEEITDVTFQFRTSTDHLNSQGITATDVVLYRYHDGEWTALETMVAGQTNTDTVFRAVSPGLSVFAIGTRQPITDIRVTDLTLSTTTIRAGDPITVSATVENRGNVTGEFIVDLLIDGLRRGAVPVTVAPGTTRSVTFHPQFDVAGEYTIQVNELDAGRLRVTRETSSSRNETTNDSRRTATPPPRSDDSSFPLTQVGIAGTLLAVIAVGAYVLRIRR